MLTFLCTQLKAFDMLYAIIASKHTAILFCCTVSGEDLGFLKGVFQGPEQVKDCYFT